MSAAEAYPCYEEVPKIVDEESGVLYSSAVQLWPDVTEETDNLYHGNIYLDSVHASQFLSSRSTFPARKPLKTTFSMRRAAEISRVRRRRATARLSNCGSFQNLPWHISFVSRQSPSTKECFTVARVGASSNRTASTRLVSTWRRRPSPAPGCIFTWMSSVSCWRWRSRRLENTSTGRSSRKSARNSQRKRRKSCPGGKWQTRAWPRLCPWLFSTTSRWEGIATVERATALNNCKTSRNSFFFLCQKVMKRRRFPSSILWIIHYFGILTILYSSSRWQWETIWCSRLSVLLFHLIDAGSTPPVVKAFLLFFLKCSSSQKPCFSIPTCVRP